MHISSSNFHPQQSIFCVNFWIPAEEEEDPLFFFIYILSFFFLIYHSILCLNLYFIVPTPQSFEWYQRFQYLLMPDYKFDQKYNLFLIWNSPCFYIFLLDFQDAEKWDWVFLKYPTLIIRNGTVCIKEHFLSICQDLSQTLFVVGVLCTLNSSLQELVAMIIQQFMLIQE